MTYKAGLATARLLQGNELELLMRDPLLRSNGLLGALFYNSAVVCEYDSDRAFYQEVNARLLRAGRGLVDAVFPSGYGNDTLHRILRPLRTLSIPAAAIVDFDIVNFEGAKWTRLATAANIPEPRAHSLGVLKGDINAALLRTCKNPKQDGGIMLLSGSERESAESLLQQLSEYGLFVVPFGELESWLKHLVISGNKAAWLPAMFERMGTDPTEPDYVAPGQ
jgi:hypothetical protein